MPRDDGPGYVTCPECNGMGTMGRGDNEEDCWVCEGAGQVPESSGFLLDEPEDDSSDEYPDVDDSELDLMEVPPTSPEREAPTWVDPGPDAWGPPKKKDIGRSNEGVTFDKFIDDILIKEGAQARRPSRKEEETGQRKRAKMGREHAHNRIRYTPGSK